MRMIQLSDKVGVTNILCDLKTKKIWTLLEQKILLLIMKKINPQMLMLTKNDYNNTDFFNIDVSHISTKYEFSRKELLDIGFEPKHFAREIDKITDLLLDKKIKTSHPEVIGCHDSFAKASWFISAYYNKNTQKVDLEIHTLALKMLTYFFKYSYIKIENIASLKSIYSLNVYMAIKMEVDSRHKQNIKEYCIDISDFRNAFNIEERYKSIHMLKTRILDSVCKEINFNTDMEIDYTLIKEGRSYAKIKFTFDYNQEAIEQKKSKKNIVKNNESDMPVNEISEVYTGYEVSPFEHTLTGWGIRAKKVVELEQNYSIDDIAKAIDETNKAASARTIKNSKAGFFIGVLENKHLASSVQQEESERQEKQNQEKAIEQSLNQDKAKQFKSIEESISLYEEDISKYLTAKSMGTPIELPQEVTDVIIHLGNIDKEFFKGYKSSFTVLDKGYFDYKTSKVVRPNIYNFLLLIQTASS